MPIINTVEAVKAVRYAKIKLKKKRNKLLETVKTFNFRDFDKYLIDEEIEANYRENLKACENADDDLWICLLASTLNIMDIERGIATEDFTTDNFFPSMDEIVKVIEEVFMKKPPA